MRNVGPAGGEFISKQPGRLGVRELTLTQQLQVANDNKHSPYECVVIRSIVSLHTVCVCAQFETCM